MPTIKPLQTKKYDVIVAGAGMAGIACALRLDYLGLKVALLEKHSVIGGLNSFYQRVKKNELGERIGIRKFDVGLHALTNFARKGEKRKPLLKILRQLRIRYDDLCLKEQSFSQSWVGEKKLNFSNDFSLLQAQVADNFPEHVQEFSELVNLVKKSEDLNLEESEFVSAKKFLQSKISNKDLVELILFPTLCYGSAWENDMDLSQFNILFRSLYLEGFSRPLGGIRTIFNILKKKLNDSQIDVFMKTGVEKILKEDGHCVVKAAGQDFKANQVFSSLGLVETQELITGESRKEDIGKMTFVEVQLFFKDQVKEKGIPTVLFYSENENVKYEGPKTCFDKKSAIICFPNNYEEYEEDEGIVRLTFMANFESWKKLDKKSYEAQKKEVELYALSLVKKLFPQIQQKTTYTDTFTPLTISKFTSHKKGTVYGSPNKKKNGKFGHSKISLIGTDQGFLGVTGSMLSGISLANKYAMDKVL